MMAIFLSLFAFLEAYRQRENKKPSLVLVSRR
nr:MAG TPA: hypothetical protein [Caudoviricetes sp.]